ncbi:ALDH-like protein [Hortaea werneckii]|uniref:Aldehyde dehydrogenase domain-containing protein n=1 Tax=Hortaea werneckii TaxID=91943 RepID=A0A3M7F4Z9_HORWE|nr:ALDH-like protein [Hortaea werneckii]KAI7570475.1 ALDH-like protein [Hortaea werneckii]KAI7613781.1 ALDH-like protein [Hortaea werneckii]KAI7630546.1 ALDH-like protein [Hortaea werneckii]KAI7680883.1 ALDH-like protein [Hortaea werneckii]
MANSFPQIRAAAIDGRAVNVYYRQRQIERLHDAITKASTEILKAIETDYGHTPAEAAIEMHLAMQALKSDYASLQSRQAHHDEYLIASGKNAGSNRRPIGVVYIEPCSRHTLFYSVIVPLSSAMATGNCVIVLLENNLHTLSSLLREVLSSSLDSDTFAIASEPIQDTLLLESALIVRQTGNEQVPGLDLLSSPAKSRTVAVVDRTADISLAARELVAATFAFGGRSPYAPDYIFVNEFVKRAFLQAVVGECAKLSALLPAEKSSKPQQAMDDFVERLRQADPQSRIVLQEQKMAVLDLFDRTKVPHTTKNEYPVMIVHGVRSLDDAIDLIGSTSNHASLAAYHFGNPATGKYLSQFVDAEVSFVNHVPRELLVGPAFPTGRPIDLQNRYPRELFTVHRPAFINSPASDQKIREVLGSSNRASSAKLIEVATAPLNVMKRHPGGGIGFFEQGFLMNAGIILTTIVSITGVGLYWLVKHGRTFW